MSYLKSANKANRFACKAIDVNLGHVFIGCRLFVYTQDAGHQLLARKHASAVTL